MTSRDTEYYTVVYAVSKGHRNEWWQAIRPLFLERDLPISVVAVSRGDAIEERDAYQERVVCKS